MMPRPDPSGGRASGEYVDREVPELQTVAKACARMRASASSRLTPAGPSPCPAPGRSRHGGRAPEQAGRRWAEVPSGENVSRTTSVASSASIRLVAVSSAVSCRTSCGVQVEHPEPRGPHEHREGERREDAGGVRRGGVARPAVEGTLEVRSEDRPGGGERVGPRPFAEAELQLLDGACRVAGSSRDPAGLVAGLRSPGSSG